MRCNNRLCEYNSRYNNDGCNKLGYALSQEKCETKKRWRKKIPLDALVRLRDYLQTCRVEENGAKSGKFNHIANIFEITRDLERSRSWYFKAAKNLQESDSNFWRASGTDLCFYRAT